MSLFELTYLNFSTNIVNYMQDCLEELMETTFNMYLSSFYLILTYMKTICLYLSFVIRITYA